MDIAVDSEKPRDGIREVHTDASSALSLVVFYKLYGGSMEGYYSF